jgi:uncharacterized protein
MTDLIEKAKIFTKDLLGTESTGHDYYHAIRVMNMAIYLAVGQNVDLDVIKLASLLHDLDDPKINKTKSSYVSDFLSKNCDKEMAYKVKEIISSISYSSWLAGKEVESIEGKIVQDADRLDALGAIGIARCFSYSGFAKRMIYDNSIEDDSAIAHFYQKLLKLESLMNTENAKLIASKRIAFMKNYLDEFFKEWR